MNNSQMSKKTTVNITVVVTTEEMDAINEYLRPFCGSKGPFIRQLVLDKIGYKQPTDEAKK